MTYDISFMEVAIKKAKLVYEAHPLCLRYSVVP